MGCSYYARIASVVGVVEGALSYRNYAVGAIPEYSSPEAVRELLRTANLSASADCVGLGPASAGIPGTTMRALGNFTKTLQRTNELASLVERARSLDPRIPWRALALYHRGMLGYARPNWAEERWDDRVAGPLRDPKYFRDLASRIKIEPGAVFVDAGCGWGRVGLHLVELLDADKYHGIDIDEFELRAFIQLELGIERPDLLAKRPRFLRTPSFDFETALDGKRADVVVFYHVLKTNLPKPLVRKAMCHAASVLKPGGKMLVAQNGCGDASRFAESTGAFEHEHTWYLHNNTVSQPSNEASTPRGRVLKRLAPNEKKEWTTTKVASSSSSSDAKGKPRQTPVGMTAAAAASKASSRVAATSSQSAMPKQAAKQIVAAGATAKQGAAKDKDAAKNEKPLATTTKKEKITPEEPSKSSAPPAHHKYQADCVWRRTSVAAPKCS
ncbi:hypothetical protein CTAYLR_009422 [Chrysophaeum taylorii]|uniref:Methyltransferase type 12 domain-containing protein n=1 Tax=Chrysophaeum taylorii TaxID=2483200 RepID=A0AAD7XKT1_9STRA|nr:hypothetical protein CTAYLR_009422 [Chrysophaeum taylorii]